MIPCHARVRARVRGECRCIRRARLTINRTTRSRRIYSRVRSPTGVVWHGVEDRIYYSAHIDIPVWYFQHRSRARPPSEIRTPPSVNRDGPAQVGNLLRQVVKFWALITGLRVAVRARWIEKERRTSWLRRKAVCSGLQSGNIEIATGGHAARKDWPMPTIAYLFD